MTPMPGVAAHPRCCASQSRIAQAASLILLSLLGACSSETAGERPQQPVPVRVAVAAAETLPVRLKALGTVTPANAVTVRSRVDGELVRVLFEEGQSVEEGQLLAEIDPRPYRVALAQAEGTLLESRVQLQNAEGDLVRFRDLLAKNFVSQQQISTQEALVRQHQAKLKSLEAAVDSARLQLAYTRITAPLSGRLGLRKVDRGNLVRSGDADGLVTITQTQPITVLFTVPETEVGNLLAAYRGDTALAVEAWDRSERQRLALGQLASIDNQIDATTGTLRLKAAFANEDGQLFPNQFVNVRLHVQDLDDAVVIPGASVQFGAQGNYVFVIGDGDKVSIRPVTLGAADGERLSITAGLKAGERVVLEGLDRLREGSSVQIIADAPAAAGSNAAATP